jgi:RHS repeat-associated protein
MAASQTGAASPDAAAQPPTTGTATARPSFDVAAPVRPVSVKPVKAVPPVRGFDARYSKAIDAYTTPTSQAFINADGTGTMMVAPEPVRFKAKNGSWQTIDLTLIRDTDGSLRPRSAASVPRLSLSQGEPQFVLPTAAGNITFQHVNLPATAVNAGTPDTQVVADMASPIPPTDVLAAPGTAITTVATLNQAQATVDVSGGRQVRYQLIDGGVQDDVVLPDASAGPTYAVQATVPVGVTAQQGNDGVEFVDSTGTVIAQYTGGEALDAVAAAADDVAPPGTYTPVAVTLTSIAAGVATIVVSIDPTWLASADRVFPVVVDPAGTPVQARESTNDVYLNSDNPDHTAPTGGTPPLTPYVQQNHLRMGAVTASGTSRIFLPFDGGPGGTPFVPPIGWVYNGSAELDMNLDLTDYPTQQQPTAWCPSAVSYGVNDIATSSWPVTFANTTWNLQPVITGGGSSVSVQSSAPADGWQLESTVTGPGDEIKLNVSAAMGWLLTSHNNWSGLEINGSGEALHTAGCWREFYSADNPIGQPPFLTAYFTVPPPTPPTETSADNGHVPAQFRFGDPIDVATGNMVDTFTDLTSPTWVDGLDWSRTYNSMDTTSAGGLGRGWSSSLYPTIQAMPGVGVTMVTAEGRNVTWATSGSGFARPAEYPADLSVVAGNYRVTFNDNTTWDFDAQGRLALITSPTGQTVTVNRNTSGQLTTAVSSTGAQLSFTYNATGNGVGMLATVTGPAGTVHYGYDASGNLTSVQDIGGQTTVYGYDTSNRMVSITDPTGVQQIFNTYNSLNQVATQKHASGATTSLTYGTYDSASGLWTTVVSDDVTGSSGTVTFYWDSLHEVRRVADSLPNPSGGTGNVSLSDFSDSLGDLTNVVSRIGGQDQYTYDTANHLTCDFKPGAICPAAGTALSSGSGMYTAYSYDTQGRMSAQYVAGTGTSTYTYTGTSTVPTTMTDPNLQVTVYNVTNGLMTQQTDADGVVTKFAYDANGRLTAQTDGAGNVTSYTYDSAGHVTCTAQPGGTCPVGGTGGSGDYTTASYYPSGLVQTQRAADGGLTQYTYDNAGKVLTVTDPTNAVTTNHYDPTTGLLTSVDKPGQIVAGVLTYVTTHYTYDANGNQTCSAPPGGTCPNAAGTGGVEPYQLTSYGPLSRVSSTTNELGQVTSYKYDPEGNKTEVDNPDGSVVTTAYDALGRAYCTTAPTAAGAAACPNLSGAGALGRYTITAFDSVGRVACVAQPGGDCVAGTGPITTYTYDSAGRQSTVTDVNGGTTTTTYTPAGRVYQVTAPLGGVTGDVGGGITTTVYDAAGRVSQVTDAAGGITTTTYTPQGWVASTTSPGGLLTSYTYDASGRQATVTAPDGVVTVNTYTLRGELHTQKVGADGTITYTYNGDSTVLSVTDALGRTTSYTYDALGNRTVRTNAVSKTQNWSYDNADEITRAADQLNRATTTTYYDDPINGHKSVATDASGRVTTTVLNPDGTTASTTFTGPGATLTYTDSYDTLGHLQSIATSSGSWNYVYSAAGDLKSETPPGLAATTWLYDAAGRRSTMTYADGAQVVYSYDAAGRMTAEKITPSGGSQATAAGFTYNPDGQLLTSTLPDGFRSYTYGTIGSAKGKIVSYTQNLPGSAVSATLGYNPDGRLASQAVTTGGALTAPSAPTGVTAGAGSANATVSWTAPTNTGGTPITGYTVTANPGGLTATTTGATSAVVSGLTNGNAYTFAVTATNAIGTSAPSSSSASVSPYYLQSVANNAEGGTAGATVAASSTTGASGDGFNLVKIGAGGALTYSAAAAAHGGLGYAISGTSGTTTSLSWNGFYGADGMAVRFYYNPGSTLPNQLIRLLDIRNATGTAARLYMSATNQLFIQDTTGTTLTTFPTPLQPSTWYRIEMAISVSPGGTINAAYYPKDGTTPVDPAYATNTGNTGTAFFTQVAVGDTTNANWTGTSYFDDIAAQPATVSYIGAGPTAPDAASFVTATAGNTLGNVSWTAPAWTGGAPITGYTVTSSPGGFTATTTGATTAAVTGLTNGTAYTFTVKATNAIGSSAASSASAAVTPVLANVANRAEGGTAGTTVTASNSGGGSGDAFGLVARGTGATLTFATAAAAHGGLGYSMGMTSGTATFMGWNAYNATSIAARIYYNPGPTLPSQLTRLLDIRNATGTAARIELSTGNQLFVQNNAGTTLTTFAHALTANTWYRIELAISVSATAATINSAYYLKDNPTPVDPAYSTTTGNTGTANLTAVQIGDDSAATWNGTSYFDDIAVQPGTTAYIGSPVPAAPTAVSAAPRNASAIVSWTAPAATGGSPITGYTVTSSPGGFTAATTGATAAAVTGLTNGTAYTFTVKATSAIGTGPSSGASTAVTPSATATTTITTTYGYDAAGQLTNQTPSNTPGTTYTYDTLGRRATSLTNGVTTTYRYDDAGELCWTFVGTSSNTCASPPTGATVYTYDASGRMLTQTTTSTNKSIDTYDNAGRLLTMQLVSGTYNTTQTRTYNPSSDLVGATNTGSSTTANTFTWDDATSLPTVATKTLSGSTTDLLTGADGQWADALIAGTPDGIGLDPQGNVIPTTPTTSLALGTGYDAWGNPSIVNTALEPTLGFDGQLQFGVTVDLRARNYNTTLGGFTTTDPADGIDGTTSVSTPYPYADNDPTNQSDPTGRSATDLNSFIWGGRYDYIAQAQALNTWIATYSPPYNPNVLQSSQFYQGIGIGLGLGGNPHYWSPPDLAEPGTYSCYGETGCAAAYAYSLTPGSNPYEAQTIAALYCVEHASACAGDNRAVTYGSLGLDLALPLGGLLGGFARALGLGAAALGGESAGLVGADYEAYLAAKLGGQTNLMLEGRQFDVLVPGSINGPGTLIEAKSGQYWARLSDPRNLGKFKSDIGSYKAIAGRNGYNFQVYSNTPIPASIQYWLGANGITYVVTP